MNSVDSLRGSATRSTSANTMAILSSPMPSDEKPGCTHARALTGWPHSSRTKSKPVSSRSSRAAHSTISSPASRKPAGNATHMRFMGKRNSRMSRNSSFAVWPTIHTASTWGATVPSVSISLRYSSRPLRETTSYFSSRPFGKRYVRIYFLIQPSLTCSMPSNSGNPAASSKLAVHTSSSIIAPSNGTWSAAFAAAFLNLHHCIATTRAKQKRTTNATTKTGLRRRANIANGDKRRRASTGLEEHRRASANAD